MMDCIKVFSPASVGNLSVGFDVLGACLAITSEELIIRKVARPGVRITKILNANLPFDSNSNIAGFAAKKLLANTQVNWGVEIEIYKKLPTASGLGSSAASAVGAVFGVNQLLDKPLSKQQLLPYAVEGEQLITIERQVDNVAPALLGSIQLIRCINTLETITLPFPKDLVVTLLLPEKKIETTTARKILKPTLTLPDATKQWGNLAAAISALYTNDLSLLSRCFINNIIENQRAKLMPYYHDVKNQALKLGAIGAGISGAGPAMFALTENRETAKKIAHAIGVVMTDKAIKHQIINTTISPNGVTAQRINTTK